MATFKQGETIKVRAADGEILERRVWEKRGGLVFICSDEQYGKHLSHDPDALAPVGFPIEDVVQAPKKC